MNLNWPVSLWRSCYCRYFVRVLCKDNFNLQCFRRG